MVGFMLAVMAVTGSSSLRGEQLVLRIAQESGTQSVPARRVPAPNSVSPELQKLMRQTLIWPSRIPRTPDEWSALKGESPNEQIRQNITEVTAKLGVTIASEVIGSVPCYVVTPNAITARNRLRRILYLHHGGWMFGSGLFGVVGAAVVAGLTGIEVIEVDYRLLPQNAFPAAMDDATAVWRELSRRVAPANIAISGYSAGGTMALALVQRAKREGLPVPGALISDAGPQDLSKTGDSYFANQGVDNQVTYDGFWHAIFKLYANGLDLKDPLISPVYGEFTGFPPTILITGTRDLFLSPNVRVHHKLLNAGVPTQLLVEEAESHGLNLQAALSGVPEGIEAYSYVAKFLDEHLGH
jgi:acetyl esterase/lipase